MDVTTFVVPGVVDGVDRGACVGVVMAVDIVGVAAAAGVVIVVCEVVRDVVDLGSPIVGG